MNIKKPLILAIFILFMGRTIVCGQDKSNVKFGKITPSDFSLSGQKIDSGAGAVVIADIGSSVFMGNAKGWFSLEFRHFKRIKILSKSGLEAASVSIPLYSSGEDVEKLEDLKAAAYNLENGKVIETKLESKSIFSDKLNKHLILKKFTFPAVKEGSIIEYSYTQSSDFLFNLQPWEFQGEYPCLWSEYEVDMPDFFNYVFLGQGYLKYDISTNTSTSDNFHIVLPGGADKDEHASFTADVDRHRWVMKNVPALKEENYTTTLRNHIAKIEFQLSQYRFPDEPVRNVMGNWNTVSEDLFKDDNFGADLEKSNAWMNDDIKNIVKGATTPLEKARMIYTWVKDNFTCTDHNARYADNPIKTVYKNRNGNVAAVNLLLDAMLKHEGIQADPVLLSTRDHGFAHTIYPLIDRYNYVICRAKIDSSVYFLDASQPWLGFGHIPGACYNGQARVINKVLPEILNLNADDITERKTTIVFLSNDEKGGISGSFQSVPGYFESCEVRQKIKDKGEKEYFKKIQSYYGTTLQISGPAIDSIRLTTDPVKIYYDFVMPQDTTEDLIYFSPVMATEAYKENPFKAAARTYPVEMPYAIDETYILNMDIPNGYVVEEMPKSNKVLFNTDEGFFEYIIQKDENNIQLRSRIKLLKADFKPDDYTVLRDFFTFVVKKENEQIVFKKKK